MRKMESQENRNNSELPDLSSLSETERLQVIAVMQRAKVTMCCNKNDKELIRVSPVNPFQKV